MLLCADEAFQKTDGQTQMDEVRIWCGHISLESLSQKSDTATDPSAKSSQRENFLEVLVGIGPIIEPKAHKEKISQKKNLMKTKNWPHKRPYFEILEPTATRKNLSMKSLLRGCKLNLTSLGNLSLSQNSYKATKHTEGLLKKKKKKRAKD